MIVTKQFTFHAAHYIPDHPHCGKMHGHTYKVEVSIKGSLDNATGMVIDFSHIKTIVQPLINKLDHNLINKTIQIPTAENIAVWFWKHIKKNLHSFYTLSEVKIFETETCWVAYRG